ncbi:hypothetical protein H6G76_19065 [Nostoc sp. FACHB-152]|uniref:hypothetical protein n=1 Tax=unclassified Nostoc TaxID=2593658 RepID=UPI0016888E41|nr:MULTISPECIES: hypothetical protein [unclassified Nostoc]MBD2449217.1 hypothetical protein [Nostoc sp. FACHB-152]MBD2466366.1 hypothetical protein [Nostoc sp. FACHB-145]
MFSSNIGWLIPAALTVVSLGSNIQSATAQISYNTYTFSNNYNTTVTIDPTFRPDLGIVRATITGKSVEPAPYGLDFFTSNTYGKLQPSENPSITKYAFNSDANVFGLEGQQVFSDRYYGGANELFGKASDSAEINFAEGTIKGGGNITIFGGTGLFENVTGTISFTQQDKLGPPGVPSQGLATLNFSLQTPQQVPEPSATLSLIIMGITGVGSLISRHSSKNTLGS